MSYQMIILKPNTRSYSLLHGDCCNILTMSIDLVAFILTQRHALLVFTLGFRFPYYVHYVFTKPTAFSLCVTVALQEVVK